MKPLIVLLAGAVLILGCNDRAQTYEAVACARPYVPDVIVSTGDTWLDYTFEAEQLEVANFADWSACRPA